MTVQLVVVRAFGPHARGDVIADKEIIAALLAGEHAHDVVRVSVKEG
ncbi:MAG: hypothetical protein J0I21_16780 [Alphaproteobacteria bacterium]|nr:hypothetical protein [Alphaproteobacteria bacterium]